MENSKANRKSALATIAHEVQLLPNEDLTRVMKLVKAELKARESLASLQAEIDE